MSMLERGSSPHPPRATPSEGLRAMTEAAEAFADSGIEVDDLGLKRPTLDDVFLRLTGHRAEDASAQETLEETA